ncbi:MAG: HD domain-containing protein, partial [Vibrio sp.]
MRMLKHIDSFGDQQNQDKHPICCDVYPRLQKRNLLIIAAIFHDIAKGRGGDHSLLGCTEAYDFCIEHGLSTPEAKLVSWLVRNHLLMSVTAQRRDIYDPDVITEFAKQVRDEEYLEHLVCLTVADICATNPELWNSWKRTLLAELFYSTQRALRRGLEHPVDVRAKIRHNQHMASADLRKENFTPREIDLLWRRFKADYFLRHTHQQIAWHSAHLLRQDPTHSLVLLNKDVTRGGTEVFVYTQDKASLFAVIAAELDRRSLTIHDAQIMTSKDGYALDTFIVLDQSGEQIDEDRHELLKTQLEKILNGESKPSDRTRRPPRQLQHFKVKTKIEFLPMRTGKRSVMELVALDAPGLLAKIGQCFADHHLSLHGAKITTIGEKAEDFFILTSPEGGRLTEEEESLVIADLKQIIDESIE